MNKKMLLNFTGKIIGSVSLLMLLPIIVAIIYGEQNSLKSFLIVAGAGIIISALLVFLFPVKNKTIYAKDGFFIVSVAWLVVSVLGAMPFVISKEIPRFIDAFFETVSGFTTTGASILTDVEKLSKSMLFWRSFTHFIGGMGVIVFLMAIIPSVSDRNIHILRAEMPGPTVDKIVPRAKDTAKILYIIYIFMTLLEIILLLLGGMPVFDSIVHSFGTAGTGGFGIKAASLAPYSSYCQWVIGIFMVLFGVNFNLYYLLIIKKAKSAFKSTELRVYLSIVAVSTLIISANTFSIYGNLTDTLKNAFFQVSSIISTTGYSTVDFNIWPTLSKSILLILMITGACGGSTAGGIKISRVILLFKMISRRLKSLIHPRSVSSIHIDNKQVDEDTVSSVGIYAIIYVVCIIAIFFVLCFEKSFDIESNLSATLACFNNIGPGLSLVGPASSYADYNAFSKAVLSFAMLLGRLEIFPMILLISPTAWKRGS